jgi:molybdenum cofactor cytidylyltransferase
VIFSRELFHELSNAPLDEGAITVVKKHQEKVLHVEVDDVGILIDIDTPELYQRYVSGSDPHV